MPKKSTKSSAKRINNSYKNWAEASFKISNPAGVHTRPAAAFVKLAQQFPAEIKVYKGKQQADGKSILNVLALGIEKGNAITIKAKGIKAKEALQALGKLIRLKFYE